MTESYTSQGNLSFKDYLSRTYIVVALGLLISAVSAFLASILMPILLYTAPLFSTILMFGMVIGEFVIAVRFSANLMVMSNKSAWTSYVAYAVLTGASFYTLFLYYDLGSLALTFIATIIMFVCMAIIGKTSKRNLMGVYGLLLPAIIAGMIVTLLNNLIFHSNPVNLFIAYIGMILFLVLTAADVQRLESFYNQSSYDANIREKLMIMGAFQLYLDFINLFLRILRFLGRRRDN